MRTSFTAPLLIGSLLLAAATAQAQIRFSAGPQVGLTLASTHFTDAFYSTSYRSGIEAGIQATIGYKHLALQPAVLFSQQGYHQHSEPVGGIGGLSDDETHRLNYLCLPLSFAYTQRANGQGAQVFAGPYLSLLLGGHYDTQTTYANGIFTHEGQVVAGNTQPDKYPFSPGYDTDFYARRFDAGVQAGLGYRHGGLLVQAQYSFGLRNQSAYVEAIAATRPAHYNRTCQLSLAYLFGPKSQ
jgi:hypothetical protein